MADITIGEHIFQATTSQDLSSGALSFTTSFSTDFKLAQITFVNTTDVQEEVVLAIDSGQGAAFDAVIFKQDVEMKSDQGNSFIYQPDQPCYFKSGDELKIDVTNNDTSGTLSVVISTIQE